jgi:hypothetical protein
MLTPAVGTLHWDAIDRSTALMGKETTVVVTALIIGLHFGYVTIIFTSTWQECASCAQSR